MNDKTILAIDQGTTSTRAILFSLSGDILAVKQKELTLHYPDNGWVEQDAEDIWNDTIDVCQGLVQELGEKAQNIATIGITNQRETTIIWDKNTGKTIYNAIVWQDRRTADFCETLKAKGYEESISAKTGLLLDPYFSGTKIKWILDNVEGAREKAQNGELLFGTVETYVLWKLTNGSSHMSDATNASRTMLYNIRDHKWDDDLLDLLDIPKHILPDVKDNAFNFGVTAKEHFGFEIPIQGMAGDQQAATIGQACFDAGMVKSTYGTGCFMLMNIGTEFKQSKNRLLTTIAYQLDGHVNYAIEGSIFVAGAAVQFLRDNLGLFSDASQTQDMAQSVDDTNGVYFVPALTGIGAPYWNADARGIISGLTRGTQKEHIVRAALEAQGYQTFDLAAAMEGDTGTKLQTIRVDGGLVNNAFVCQFLADILNVRIDVPKVTETTAWGAACLAALQSGLFSDLLEIAGAWREDKKFKPQIDPQKRTALIEGWSNSVSKVV